MTDSRWLYLGLLAVVAAMRLFELRISKVNTRRALAAGAVELGHGHYRWMVLLHTAFLASCGLEVWILDRRAGPLLSSVMLAVLMLASGLRWWVIRSLGDRWTTRVVCFPGREVVTSGPYRYLRHPNYVAVAAELIALPLVHGAWLTAVVFSILNVLLMVARVRVEERGLSLHSDYDGLLGDRPRFLPRRP